MARRRLGQLEAEILAVLAGNVDAMSIASLLHHLEGPPAHTTVHTVLSRLIHKGMVRRQPEGKGYAYELTVDESEVAAEKMFSPLRSANDPRLVLNQFARGLSPQEVQALLSVLGEARERE